MLAFVWASTFIHHRTNVAAFAPGFVLRPFCQPVRSPSLRLCVSSSDISFFDRATTKADSCHTIHQIIHKNASADPGSVFLRNFIYRSLENRSFELRRCKPVDTHRATWWCTVDIVGVRNNDDSYEYKTLVFHFWFIGVCWTCAWFLITIICSFVYWPWVADFGCVRCTEMITIRFAG